VTDIVKKLIHLTLILALFAFARGAVAQLQIEIIDGNPSALPIAVVPFQWMEAGPPPADAVDAIVAGDLYRSGLFDPMAVEDMPEKPSEPEGIRFGTWRLLKVDYIVVGRCARPPTAWGTRSFTSCSTCTSRSSCCRASPRSAPATCASAPTGWRMRSTRS
jgi:hypothetical protein